MIFITSEAGSMANSGVDFPAYSISKTAANKIVYILRATVGEKYKIYAMHPGRMNTDMGRATAIPVFTYFILNYAFRHSVNKNLLEESDLYSL